MKWLQLIFDIFISVLSLEKLKVLNFFRFWTLRSKEFFLYLSFLCIFSLCFFKSFSSANQSRASFITSIKQSLVQAQLKALSQGSAKKQNSFFIRFLSLVLSFFTPNPLPLGSKRVLLPTLHEGVFRWKFTLKRMENWIFWPVKNVENWPQNLMVFPKLGVRTT